MLPKTALERIVPILRRDAKRALRMRVRGFPTPYYCSFLLRDINWFNTSASSGSLYRRRSDHTRNVYCDLRVGSYSYDQTTEGGLSDNDEERDSVSNVSVPTDDKVYDGLRLALWRLTEAKFREALADYNAKEAARLTHRDPSEVFPSFTKLPKLTRIAQGRPENVDEEKWVRFCKQMSKFMSELPHVAQSWVEFDVSHESRVFVSTENRLLVQHAAYISLSATLRRRTSDGLHLEQELVINCGALSELPTAREFKQRILAKYEQLNQLVRARKIHAFSGPVLLYPVPAGLLIHEALGHRLEGSRLLSSGEGQTFQGQAGKRIINVDLTIRDDPTKRRFNGKRCIGAYEFDDEGAAAANALLVEHGELKGFLTSRAAITKRNHVSNGHGRSKKHQRPISRMAVTIVEGGSAHNINNLRRMLLAQIKKQNKPFGMIVYEATNGETETSAYDFQGFRGEIAYATLLYPDGKEIPVRGVNFVGTPLQALNNIIAVGDSAEVDNSFCGAESGFVPVTTISPAILLSNLELQHKDEEPVSEWILPRPKL